MKGVNFLIRLGGGNLFNGTWPSKLCPGAGPGNIIVGFDGMSFLHLGIIKASLLSLRFVHLAFSTLHNIYASPNSESDRKAMQ